MSCTFFYLYTSLNRFVLGKENLQLKWYPQREMSHAASSKQEIFLDLCYHFNMNLSTRSSFIIVLLVGTVVVS